MEFTYDSFVFHPSHIYPTYIEKWRKNSSSKTTFFYSLELCSRTLVRVILLVTPSISLHLAEISNLTWSTDHWCSNVALSIDSGEFYARRDVGCPNRIADLTAYKVNSIDLKSSDFFFNSWVEDRSECFSSSSTSVFRGTSVRRFVLPCLPAIVESAVFNRPFFPG